MVENDRVQLENPTPTQRPVSRPPLIHHYWQEPYILYASDGRLAESRDSKHRNVEVLGVALGQSYRAYLTFRKSEF